MDYLGTSSFKLGIVAGGQMAKMLALEASKWDVKTLMLDNDPECPGANVCTELVLGDIRDYQAVLDFGRKADLITFDIEHANVEALQQLKEEGKTIHPDPDIITLVQDKGLQKLFFQDHGLPSPKYSIYKNKAEVILALKKGELDFPFVQKTRNGWYQAREVVVINSRDDMHMMLEGSSLVEEKIDIAQELAVVLQRSTKGQIACFSPVEMHVNVWSNRIETLAVPASIDEALEQKATQLAKDVIACFDLCGTMAVEIFVDTAGKLWVNEVVPRPHISNHHTIESAYTSQYEQHLRAIFGFGLGSARLKLPAVVINLLGEPGVSGPVKYEGLEECLEMEGVKLHIYGKQEVRPYRKMGHVTIIAQTLAEAWRKAAIVRKKIRVTAHVPVSS